VHVTEMIVYDLFLPFQLTFGYNTRYNNNNDLLRTCQPHGKLS